MRIFLKPSFTYHFFIIQLLVCFITLPATASPTNVAAFQEKDKKEKSKGREKEESRKPEIKEVPRSRKQSKPEEVKPDEKRNERGRKSDKRN